MACPITLTDLTDTPQASLAARRGDGPVTWVEALRSWVVIGWDAAVEVLRDADTFTVDDPRFTTAQVIGPSMLSLDGAEHRRHRHPFAGAFRPRRVRERFAEFVSATTDRLLAEIDARTADHADAATGAELRTALAGPLAAAVVAESLGLDGADDDVVGSLVGWYRTIVESVSELGAGRHATPAGDAAFEALDGVVRTHLDAASSDDDAATSLLIEAAGGGHLSVDEIVSNAAVIMFGGIETTEGMILNVLWHLLTRPDQLARVRDDPGLVGAAVTESLRLEPAAAVVDRYATRDATLYGTGIAAGDMVTVSLAAANRDPAVFDDPDAFDLDRLNANRHLAFAQGPHVCVAMDLARLEAETAVADLLGRFPGIRLASPHDTSAPSGLVFRKPAHVHVTW